MTVDHIVATMTVDHIVATVALVHIVASVTLVHTVAIMALDTTVAFVIPLVALLTSSPVMCRKEHLWNVSVLHRVFI
jgi:hypothetical protein